MKIIKVDVLKFTEDELKTSKSKFIDGLNKFFIHETVDFINRVNIFDSEIAITFSDQIIHCPIDIDEYGVMTIKMNAGFILQFMPPMMLRHPKMCGERAANIIYDIFCAEINWHNEQRLKLLNKVH